jgi:hypothetical protein
MRTVPWAGLPLVVMQVIGRAARLMYIGRAARPLAPAVRSPFPTTVPSSSSGGAGGKVVGGCVVLFGVLVVLLGLLQPMLR